MRLGVLAALAAMACGRSATGPEAAAVRVTDAVTAVAAHRLAPTADAVGQLEVTVTLTNRTAARAEVALLDPAPFVIRLYPEGHDDVPVNAARDDTRLPRSVSLAPGASDTLRDAVRRDRLRDLGAVRGRFRVVAVLTTGAPVEVPAGEIVLP